MNRRNTTHDKSDVRSGNKIFNTGLTFSLKVGTDMDSLCMRRVFPYFLHIFEFKFKL